MKLRIWGSTGSIASPGAAHTRYGGNTSCCEVVAADGERLILDGGTGVRDLGDTLAGIDPVHLVLTHVHLDHVQGLGFFAPFFSPGREVHIWGPPAGTGEFRDSLDAYFSHPLFPVTLDMLACDLQVHDLPGGSFEVGGFTVETSSVAHPGATVGVRVEADGAALAYLPDHEPMHGHGAVADDDGARALCSEANVVIHDAMYLDPHYERTRGFGHSSVSLMAEFMRTVEGAGALVPWHQDPSYGDDVRDTVIEAVARNLDDLEVLAPFEGREIVISG